MIDFKELRRLLDKATPGPWETFKSPHGQGEFLAISNDWSKNDNKFCLSPMVWNCVNEDIELLCTLRNNADELLRLAEIGKRYDDIATDIGNLGAKR